MQTPYDTGDALEPHPWPLGFTTPTHDAPEDLERFGKVDFDNENGETVLTLSVTRKPDGTYTLRYYTHTGDTVTIEQETE